MKGKILNNRYELGNIIGIGGMAYVYDGFDQVLERKVAIKILREQFTDDENFINKLKDEATLSASIVDDNIVSIYDIGTTEIDGKSVDYIVMEKIEGKTLKDIIEEEAPLTEEKILYYSRQIAKALQTAHRHGLVHRDIKPANILITNEDKVKVVDFGIAHVSSEATITYTSSILGTVHYISPEQAKGLHLDSRSDLYSLGVVMYEMATGKAPFDGDSPVSIAIKHIQETPENIRSINPNISESLENIINNLMEKDLDDRYKTAYNLVMDLDKCINGLSIGLLNKTEKIPVTEAYKESAKYVAKKSDKEITTNKEKRNYWKISLIVLIICFSFAAIYYLWNSRPVEIKEEKLIEVPDFREESESDALKKIADLGLVGDIKSREYDLNIRENHVISQTIKPKARVEKGTTISLVISRGLEPVEVPNLIGLDINDIGDYLSELGLELGDQGSKNDDRPKKQIIKQSPAKGEKVAKGSKINVVVSDGPKEEQAYVPRVDGLTQSMAIQTLKESGLNPRTITSEYSDTVKENFVISQSIAPGTKVKKGSDIGIVISLGKMSVEEENVPNDGKNDTNINDKVYTFLLNLPSKLDKDGFNVKIYNLVPEKSLILEKNFNKNEAVDGKIKVTVNAPKNAKFEIYYDDKLTDIGHE